MQLKFVELTLDYISSTGDKPMGINWRMQQPILSQFIKVG